MSSLCPPDCPLCYPSGYLEKYLRAASSPWNVKLDLGTPTPPESSSASQPAKPVPTSYGVNNDLRRVARETLSAQEAQAHLENVEEGLATAKEEAEDRRLIEKALKAVAKLERRNIAARRFSLAYRAISGGSMVTLVGVEFGGSGKVHLAGSGYPFGNTHDSLDALRRAALAKGYYVAVSYVDKD